MNEESRTKGPEAPLRVLWDRKWLVIAVTLVGTVLAGIVSKSLDPVYEATAKLLVVQSSDTQSFDAVQAAQVTARTYADILASDNIADQVAERLGGGVTGSDVARATSFEPIPETQLLRITAEQPTAEAARRMANDYAEVFTAYAARELRETTQASVSLADRAPLPPAPARPKPTLYTLLAGLLSLGLGIGAAFVRDRFSTRVSAVDDLEADFGLVPLARVPRRGRTATSKAAFAEAFRIARVGLLHLPDGSPAPRTVMITSTTEGEGKTTATRHLGFAAAETGQRVLLVEADVYRPQLRAALGMPARSDRGLITYLTGKHELEEVVETTGAPNVYLLPAGPTALSLAALLDSPRGARLLDRLAGAVDLVLVDSPPLLPRADAALIAGRVDAVVLVVDRDIATTDALRSVMRTLKAVGGNVAGAIINRDGDATSSYSAYLAQQDDVLDTEDVEPAEPAGPPVRA